MAMYCDIKRQKGLKYQNFCDIIFSPLKNKFRVLLFQIRNANHPFVWKSRWRGDEKAKVRRRGRNLHFAALNEAELA
jgi:hypothetical protein